MPIETTTAATSVVSAKAKIAADIRGGESLLIEGYVKGTIELEGDIIVATSGVVEADLTANNIIIQGTVRGNAIAREHLEILSSGNMTGDISARSLDLREGSSFEGRSRMIKSEAAVATKQQPAVPNEGETSDSGDTA